MRPSCALSSAALLAAAITSSSEAAITAFWVPVASGNGSVGAMYSALALADDPQLTNMQTWDLQVTTDGNWASAGVRLTLPAGNFFYKHVLGGSTKPIPPIFVLAPALEFTSYVTAPADNGVTGAPSILGFFPEEPGPGSIGDPTSAIPGVFSFSWGDLFNDPPGTYQIMRVTFPLGMIPDIHPESRTSQVNPDSTTSLAIIPEPTALAPLVALTLLIQRRPSRP